MVDPLGSLSSSVREACQRCVPRSTCLRGGWASASHQCKATVPAGMSRRILHAVSVRTVQSETAVASKRSAHLGRALVCLRLLPPLLDIPVEDTRHVDLCCGDLVPQEPHVVYRDLKRLF